MLPSCSKRWSWETLKQFAQPGRPSPRLPRAGATGGLEVDFVLAPGLASGAGARFPGPHPPIRRWNTLSPNYNYRVSEPSDELLARPELRFQEAPVKPRTYVASLGHGAHMPRIVCISDTHTRHEELEMPPGDILVHAGDLTDLGDETDVVDFDRWLGTLPYPHKIVIAGNHDFLFERDPVRARRLITNAVYLQDSEVEVEGLRFWGSPWQPWFYDWAFNLARGEPLAAKWRLIPEQTDVLITHGPPAGICDTT